MNIYALVLVHISSLFAVAYGNGRGTVSPSQLEMFVEEIPDMPRIQGYDVVHGVPVPKKLKITMFQKYWKFHRDLPRTKVFAYGETKRTATVPGPTIEAVHGVSTRVRWQNRLPPKHILQWDCSIPMAMYSCPNNRGPQVPNKTGVPTVVHLHGGINEPQSDGHSNAWFTARFKERGPHWSKKTYHYPNQQQPGNLYYHDHAMGLTRVNLLAGLFGAYVIRHHHVEAPLGLPSGHEFDRSLLVFDRKFYTNGSIYMEPEGNNPGIHKYWQPEYFGDVIVVNGKAWPYMNKLNNAEKCHIEKYARGEKLSVEPYEKGWKNVYKMHPGYVTKIIVKFGYIHANASYPFDVTAEPGYVYHCHILDHEDNVMMRPFKFVK